MEEIQNYINGDNKYNLELGNLYSKTKNGRIFDRTFQTALKLTANDGIERVIIINNPDQISTASQELAENELAANDPYLTKMAKSLLDTAIDQTILKQTIKDLNEQADPFPGFNSFSFKTENEKSQGKNDHNYGDPSESGSGDGGLGDGGPDGGGPSDSKSDRSASSGGRSSKDNSRDDGPGGSDDAKNGQFRYKFKNIFSFYVLKAIQRLQLKKKSDKIKKEF